MSVPSTSTHPTATAGTTVGDRSARDIALAALACLGAGGAVLFERGALWGDLLARAAGTSLLVALGLLAVLAVRLGRQRSATERAAAGASARGGLPGVPGADPDPSAHARRLAHALSDLHRAEGEQRRRLSAAQHALRQPISAGGMLLHLLERDVARLPTAQQGQLPGLAAKLEQAFRSMDDTVGSIAELMASDPRRTAGLPRYVAWAELAAAGAGPDPGAVAATEQLAGEARLLYADPAMLRRLVRGMVDEARRRSGGAPIVLRQHVREAKVWRWAGPSASMTAFDADPPFRNAPLEAGDPLTGLVQVARLAGCSLRSLARPDGLVRIGLDLSPLVVDLPMPSASPLEDAAPQTDPAPMDVLVIDDDADVTGALRLLLEHWGCTVHVCAGGAAALDYLLGPAPAPALILLDNWLPDAEGVELVARLRDRAPDARCALITGDPSEAMRARAQAAGVPVLLKPINFGKLRGALAQLVPAAC
jgi:CheY-like chemotaxis protein/signal transduction histidine kinase